MPSTPERRRTSAAGLFVALAGVILLTERPALAYIDPGAGSLIYQALLAGLLGAGFFFRRSSEAIRGFFRERLSRRDSRRA